VVALASTLTLMSMWAPAARAQSFTVASTDSGLDAVRATHPTDWWLSGVTLIDLDGDGDLDLFLSGHDDLPAVVALNDGHGHFTVATGNTPTTEAHLPYDADEDGKVDLTVTYSDGGAQWYLNRSGPAGLDFTATSVIRDGNLGRQQAMVDIDGDGKVDWLRGGGSGVLIDLGDGKGGFANTSRTVANPGSDGVTVIPVDIDGDGDKDLIVEWGRYDADGPDGATRLYRNDGGTFTDATTASGLYQKGLAVLGVGDFDNDGDTDLIALEQSTFPHSIFLNDGQGHFTKKAGAITGAPSGGANYASWGLAAVTDLDNDGIPDIIVDGRNYLHVLRGTGGGAFTFANQSWGGIVNTAEASVDSGFAFGDVDGDGDLDLIGYKTLEPNRTLNLYRNDLPAQHFINVRPVGTAGNRGAAGADIRVYAAGTNQLLSHEEVVSYCKQTQQSTYAYGETERHFGLGARTSVDVAVQFYPSRKLVRSTGVPADSTIRISEDGSGTIVPRPDGGVGGAPDAGAGGSSGSAGRGGGTGGAAGAGAPGGASGGSVTGGASGGGVTGGAAGAPGGASGASGPSARGVSGGCACDASGGGSLASLLAASLAVTLATLLARLRRR
jgi:hypothetical protein